jgi:hypothetical protein
MPPKVAFAAGRHRQAVHAVELGLEGETAVAAVALLAGSRDGGEDPLAVDLAHPLAGHFDEEQGPGSVKVHAERRAQLGLNGERAVGSLATAGHQDDLPLARVIFSADR